MTKVSSIATNLIAAVVACVPVAAYAVGGADDGLTPNGAVGSPPASRAPWSASSARSPANDDLKLAQRSGGRAAPSAASTSTSRPSVTVIDWIKSKVRNPARRKAFADSIGSFKPGEPQRVATLRSVYGSISPSELAQKLDEDFGFATAYGKNQPWHRQITLCNGNQPAGKARDAQSCVDLDDTVDWLAIQMALFSVPKDGSTWLLLDKQAAHYAINQPLSVPSRTRLAWEPGKEGRYSFVFSKENPQTPLGSMLTPYNRFRHSGPATLIGDVRGGVARHDLVEDVVIRQPHLDGRFASGDNGISFVRASRNIRVEGGIIRNLRFHPTIQSGRAFMCEQGCIMTITGTQIENATFGISSHVFQNKNILRQINPLLVNQQSVMSISNVKMSNVEIPFSFFNRGGGDNSPDRQQVTIEHVTIRNSGALVRTTFPNRALKFFSYVDRSSGRRVSCLDRTGTSLAETYDLVNERTKPNARGIFYFEGGRNVTIRDIDIVNDPSYPMIGGVIRGEDGKNIVASNVRFKGRADAIFNFTGTPTGPKSAFSDSRFSNFTVSGYRRKQEIDLTRIALSRAVQGKSGGAACSLAKPNKGKLRNVSISGVTFAPLAEYAR